VPTPPYPRPPLKTQGGKTRLLSQLLPQLEWDGGAAGRWIEPFVGGAAVVLAKAPGRARLADANPHLISVYSAMASGELTGACVRAHLHAEAEEFAAQGADHYYRLRKRFNEAPTPLDLVTLNHNSFNGIMRFNSAGAFNTPFCRNPEKLTPSLIATIAGRVDAMRTLMADRDWVFAHADWREALATAKPNDFVYLDPPYFGRSAGYYNAWPESEARALAAALHQLPCRWALSDWLTDSQARENGLLRELYGGCKVVALDHRYVVGARAASRGRMTEALVLSIE
jgi:DNA adenine methylase